MAVDMAKTRLVSGVTAAIEALQRQRQALAARRERMEAHDVRHEQLVRKNAALPFTKVERPRARLSLTALLTAL